MLPAGLTPPLAQHVGEVLNAASSCWMLLHLGPASTWRQRAEGEGTVFTVTLSECFGVRPTGWDTSPKLGIGPVLAFWRVGLKSLPESRSLCASCEDLWSSCDLQQIPEATVAGVCRSQAFSSCSITFEWRCVLMSLGPSQPVEQ